VEVASSLLFLFDRVRGEWSISELSFGDLSRWEKGALRGEIAERTGVSVNPVEGISLFAHALGSNWGGDLSNGRVWSSFLLRLSAAD
jgi:hypothetical protein